MRTGIARNRPRLARVGLLVAGSTLLLTASLVGVLALTTGAAAGVAGRLPAYAVLAAVAFVAAVVAAEGHTSDGRRVLAAAVGAAGVTLLAVGLSGEGLVYAATNPDRVLDARLLLYYVAAALVGTGLGYWGLNHWREVTRASPGPGSGP